MISGDIRRQLQYGHVNVIVIHLSRLTSLELDTLLKDRLKVKRVNLAMLIGVIRAMTEKRQYGAVIYI